MSQRIEIPLSKVKIIWIFLIGIVFVIVGILFVSNPEGYVSSKFRNPEIIWFGGVLSISFFGLALLFALKMLFDKKPGLIIDNYGVTDNSTRTSVGLIYWEDIVGVSTSQVSSAKYIVLKVKNPDKYIAKEKNKMQRWALKMNNNIWITRNNNIKFFKNKV